MKIIQAILFLIIAIVCVNCVENVPKPNTATPHDICSTCKCSTAGKFINCGYLNLFRLFPIDDWTALNTSTNKVAVANVEFDNNGIEEVTQFPKLDIRTLSFRHNKIRKIEPRAFRNLTLLEKLDLSFNYLTYEALRPEVFEGTYDATVYEPLKNMRWLSLSNNRLHSLDPDLFEHFPQLETLILCHNPFMIIDHNSVIAISTIPLLKTLDMSDMELKDLPEHIFNTPRQLKNLNLTGNLFDKIPVAIQHAINLIDLNIDDNPIHYLGTNHSVFPHLPKLETLSVSYMPDLKIIGNGTFSNLPALLHISCQNNVYLSEIHAHAFAKPGAESAIREEWPPIRSLILFNNNLSTLDHNLIGRWDEIDEIDIRYNPWKCDCVNQWMVDQLIPLIKEKSKTTPALFEDIKCHQPIEMAKMSFLEIYKKGKPMRCEDYYGHRPERDGPILVGIFIGLVIGIPVTMAMILVYKRGCFGLFGYRPNPNDYGRAFYKRTELREDMYI